MNPNNIIYDATRNYFLVLENRERVLKVQHSNQKRGLPSLFVTKTSRNEHDDAESMAIIAFSILFDPLGKTSLQLGCDRFSR